MQPALRKTLKVVLPEQGEVPKGSIRLQSGSFQLIGLRFLRPKYKNRALTVRKHTARHESVELVSKYSRGLVTVSPILAIDEASRCQAFQSLNIGTQ